MLVDHVMNNCGDAVFFCWGNSLFRGIWGVLLGSGVVSSGGDAKFPNSAQTTPNTAQIDSKRTAEVI